MTEAETNPREAYYNASESWSDSQAREIASSRRVAWIVAGILGAIAVLEAIALIVLLPLKTVVPYTLLVDKQTGYVEALKPLEQKSITPDSALVRSFLVQYVIARESFDVDSLKDNYRKVALWSADAARSRYVAASQASNPESFLATLPRRAIVEVKLRSVSSLGPQTSLVRFSTIRTDTGAQAGTAQDWAAVIKYKFSGAAMTAEDRMINPLGFQVTRYRRDAETLAGTQPTVNSPPMSGAMPSPLPLAPNVPVQAQ